LLRTYVDVAILRDVIERHGVTNPTALRWLQRHLLGNPAASFSVQKFFAALKSQGLPVGKNTLHEYLAHLEDAFLVRTVSLHTASERQRMVNPRKAYPIDPGLISLYERTGRAHVGRALETVVFLELERRGCAIDYVRTRDGYEVDFVARDPAGGVTLIQACTDVGDADTAAREVRALAAAAAEYPDAIPLLLTFDTLPPRTRLPASLHWQPAIAWLLGDEL
jgi:predicted AAA+ superfamily ATPase